MVLARLTPATQLEFLSIPTPIFTSGATPERARLQERFLKACGSDSLPSNGPCTSGAIPEQETSVCDGSDSLRKGTVPKTAHNEGADPKTELEKVEHCFAARLLVGLLPLLSGLLSCGAPCLWVLVWACLPWRVPCCVFPNRGATSPEPTIF